MMHFATGNVSVMGCQVQRGLSNTNILNAIHQSSSDTNLQHSDAFADRNVQYLSASPRESFSHQLHRQSSRLYDALTSAPCTFTSSAFLTWSGVEENRSAFLGGYPMLPSNDPLFRAFSQATPRFVINDNNTSYKSDVHHLENNSEEIFARKVFIGGLPFDINQAEIVSTFSQFGSMVVDWPYRSDTPLKPRSTHPSQAARSLKGYVFIVFEEETSVQRLVRRCHKDGDDYYLLLSSPTMKNKPVQIRPWRLADISYKLLDNMDLDSRRTVFIGGVPRPTKAGDLARLLERLYGCVCYAGIDIDPELKYPKGAARVTFATTAAFIAAINGRFVNIICGGITKRVEIKPYVMDEQMCDECYGARCSDKYATYFCGDVSCLQYFCEECWDQRHNSDKIYIAHKPLVRLGDQIKLLPQGPHLKYPFVQKDLHICEGFQCVGQRNCFSLRQPTRCF
uniref:Cytoplasmic polyadenylation element-binding protein 1 n=2 Tax=Ascaris TaxID=6251 RepID=F1KZM5_ASCSU